MQNELQEAAGRRVKGTVRPAGIPARTGRAVENWHFEHLTHLRWTNKSTRMLAEELAGLGYDVSHVTVARCLRDLGYSLQASVKTLEGPQHPDRDAQFRYINAQVTAFMRSHDPVVSVDTKKKELVGAFANRGRRWKPAGQPDPVFIHDFSDLGEGKAIPYGTYDLARDEAVVNVGITHETAEFAVESIRRWWRLLGRRAYPRARRLLICADAGAATATASPRGRCTCSGWPTISAIRSPRLPWRKRCLRSSPRSTLRVVLGVVRALASWRRWLRFRRPSQTQGTFS